MKKNVYIMVFASLFLWNCSAFQKSETSEKDDSQNVYVFDNISVKDSSNNVAEELPKPDSIVVEELSTMDNRVDNVVEMYIVQVGAFSTLEKAESFVENIKDKIDYDLNIHFSGLVGLQVIQLQPFRTREKAEKIRNELRKIKELEGTFIVPKNK